MSSASNLQKLELNIDLRSLVIHTCEPLLAMTKILRTSAAKTMFTSRTLPVWGYYSDLSFVLINFILTCLCLIQYLTVFTRHRLCSIGKRFNKNWIIVDVDKVWQLIRVTPASKIKRRSLSVNERDLLFSARVSVYFALAELLNHILWNNLYSGVVLMVCEMGARSALDFTLYLAEKQGRESVT
jgi:hypothetical protein